MGRPMDSVARRRVIDVAAGRSPADLVLRGGQVVNVCTGEIRATDIALAGDRIAGLGQYEGRRTVDLGGRFVLPGFIDGHIHLESSMVTPREFARWVLRRGTTTVICDPHEIANVCGVNGIRYLLEGTPSPLDIFALAPSCVPASPLETSGATLGADRIRELLQHPQILGLGEMMNFPGVIGAQPEALGTLEAAGSRVIDGHAPGVSGLELQAYVAGGPDSDHECREPDEAREKLRAGMWLYVREGSSGRDLAALGPVVREFGPHRMLFVTDDCSPLHLLRHGHLDHVLRRAVAEGVEAVDAVSMVTLQPALRFGLHDRGALVPGRLADLVVVEDLLSFKVHKIYKRGQPVDDVDKSAESRSDLEHFVRDTCRLASIRPTDFEVALTRRRARVIELTETPVFTRGRVEDVSVDGGHFVPDPERDLLTLAVVERHRASGRIGRGIVRGFGLKRGALASSVAHDSHNIVAIGCNAGDICAAVAAVAEVGGGQAVVADGGIQARLRLPLAGLLSDGSLSDVGADLDKLGDAARVLGCPLAEPFMHLSFLALPVIPELKLTDRGLVDVAEFRIVPLEA